MDANPVLKPKLATPTLILSSVAVGVCAAYLAGTVAANWPSQWIQLLTAIACFLAVAIVGTVWWARIRRRRSWMSLAFQKWKQFENAKRTHGTTTEVTVLSVDALEPTGSWITLKWNRFDHVQPAWIEALRDPIWPGTVLLITPDPQQIRIGSPWPATYVINSSSCHAAAPASVKPHEWMKAAPRIRSVQRHPSV